MSLYNDENNFKQKEGVDKNYLWNPFSRNIWDLDFWNTFLNSKKKLEVSKNIGCMLELIWCMKKLAKT